MRGHAQELRQVETRNRKAKTQSPLGSPHRCACALEVPMRSLVYGSLCLQRGKGEGQAWGERRKGSLLWFKREGVRWMRVPLGPWDSWKGLACCIRKGGRRACSDKSWTSPTWTCRRLEWVQMSVRAWQRRQLKLLTLGARIARSFASSHHRYRTGGAVPYRTPSKDWCLFELHKTKQRIKY